MQMLVPDLFCRSVCGLEEDIISRSGQWPVSIDLGKKLGLPTPITEKIYQELGGV